MSRLILLGRADSVPGTNTEPVAAEQPPVGGIGVMESPPDPPGEEMSKEARVWRTYVREADRWDKEMIDGRNNSLDVLLIFAALFSAISTAFIIQSLDDLKPDPAESSAQTLLLMSRTLTALTNGQPAPSPLQDEPNTAKFHASRSAVVVNVLWLLSLSLSVAVSLIAMLAKEWCHHFMSGRSGQMYEQARRRQQKWNGMERWKMAQVLEQLPGAMHLALLLFAAGLCVYLWNINISVAIPVLAVTGVAILTYGFTTIMPLMVRFCPYSTPLTIILLGIQTLFRPFIYSGFRYLWLHVTGPEWLESALEGIKDRLDPRNLGRVSGLQAHENSLDPADIITSQIIAWMVTNCEDSRSVDIALQALAGARDGLPHTPLEECDAFTLVLSRLEQSCALFETTSEALSAQQLAAMAAALRYLHGSAKWVYRRGSTPHYDRWTRYVDASDTAYSLERGVCLRMARVYKKTLMPLARHRTGDVGILAIAASVPFCHWYLHGDDCCETLAASIGDALDYSTSALENHFQENGVALSITTLHALVESSVHFLVGRWPREEDHGRHSSLPVLLTRVFVTSYHTAPETAHAAVVALASGAFAEWTYPGGEKPTLDYDDREERAVQVLQYYRTHKPEKDKIFALYIFGFYSWLPWFFSNGFDEQLATIARDLSSITTNDDYRIQHILHQNIRTLPHQFSLLEYAIQGISSCVSSANFTGTESQISVVTISLLLFFTRSDFNQSHIGMYLVSLIALCCTQSRNYQELCMQVIAAQRLPDAPLQELNSVDGQALLKQLCRALFHENTAVVPFAAVHFGLLVAHIASYQFWSLGGRQSALRPLLSLHDNPGSPQDCGVVNLGDLVSHLEAVTMNRSTTSSLQSTMSFVANFCNPSPATDPDPDTGFTETTDWRRKLGELKESYQPSFERLERLYAEQQGGSVLRQPCYLTQAVNEEPASASGTIETVMRLDE